MSILVCFQLTVCVFSFNCRTTKDFQPDYILHPHAYDLQSANIITCLLSYSPCQWQLSSKSSRANWMKLYYLHLANNKLVSVLAVVRCTSLETCSTHRIVIENILATSGASATYILGFWLHGRCKEFWVWFSFLSISIGIIPGSIETPFMRMWTREVWLKLLLQNYVYGLFITHVLASKFS